MSLADQYAGDVGSLGIPYSCYLYEGHIQVKSGRIGRTGRKHTDIDYESELHEGDLVEIFSDAALTNQACRGLPVLREATAGDTFVGEIVSIQPARGFPADENEVTALATMLSQDLLRTATVEIYGLQATMLRETLIPANGGGADNIVPGAYATVAWDISEKKWKYVASGGLGLVPFHYLAGSTSVAVNGPVLYGLGPIKVNKIS
jgi:hypothetical protein